MGENDELWITLGLDEDLDEAMRKSTREAIRFLVNEYGISEEIAYAYLSAATDFEVSQVVDKTKGIHAMILPTDLDMSVGFFFCNGLKIFRISIIKIY